MVTHNICLYKEVDKKYTGYNLKTMELLDCALIGVCAVIRSNTVLVVLFGLFGATVFDLITAQTPISPQSSNFLVFRLQIIYFLFIALEEHMLLLLI